MAISCGGGHATLALPEVPAGEYEADCQALCTLAADETICTAEHAKYCLAACRARTNGLPALCGDCLVAAGTQIHGFVAVDDARYCVTGGPGEVEACAIECDAPGDAPSADLEALCTLECSFYIQAPEPRTCSADKAAECLAECAAAVAAHGRVCAQCLIDHTIPSLSCIGDSCDCRTYFNADTQGGCMTVCDAS